MEKLDRLLIAIICLCISCCIGYSEGYYDGIDYANEKYNIKIDKQIDSGPIKAFELKATINHILYLDSIKNHDLMQLLNEKTRPK